MCETSSKHTRGEYYGDWDKLEYIDGVFENILSRLPVRTLLELKSVSKHWYSVISTPQFAKLQIIRSTENSKYILFPESCSGGTDAYLVNANGEIDQVLNLRCFEETCDLVMISSFNGLICCINVPFNFFDLEIYVINPSTREILLLPKASPSEFHSQGGVFYGPEENQYKIFWFFCDPNEPEDNVDLYYLCDVYNSKTGLWRRIGRVPFCPMVNTYCPLSTDQVFVGGKLYWFLEVEEELEVIIPGSILAVDENDNFKIINLPGEEVTVWSIMIDLEGSLGLVSVDKSVVYIWVLTDYEKSTWCLRVRTEFCVGEIDTFESVAARMNEIFFIVKDSLRNRRFLIYNLGSESWREVHFGNTFERLYPAVFPFTESLLPCSRPLE